MTTTMTISRLWIDIGTSTLVGEGTPGRRHRIGG
jgi:hypothetical protein